MLPKFKPKIWAHRGFSGNYPENTIPAFKAALNLGVQGLEFDVHLTKDGEVVVIHDDTVDRTTNGSGRVADLTLRELKSLDAGSWFHPRFRNTQIPSLTEVLELISIHPNPVEINIEIKPGGTKGYPGIEDRLWQMVCAYGLERRTLFSSFDHAYLERLKRAHPAARTGVLYVERLVEPWRYARFLHAEALHPSLQALDKKTVLEAHLNGIAVHVYTVNDPASFRRLVRWGVDAVITDVPHTLMSRV
jgi:glycerophosphoryl diester phosphodiesterase